MTPRGGRCGAQVEPVLLPSATILLTPDMPALVSRTSTSQSPPLASPKDNKPGLQQSIHPRIQTSTSLRESRISAQSIASALPQSVFMYMEPASMVRTLAVASTSAILSSACIAATSAGRHPAGLRALPVLRGGRRLLSNQIVRVQSNDTDLSGSFAGQRAGACACMHSCRIILVFF